MNDQPLLPCPYCKLDGHIYRQEICDLTTGYETTRYWVQCNICGGRTGFECSLTSSINLWNTRNAVRVEDE